MENYKEKYEQALAKAKAIHNLASETSHENTRMAIEELFPELKESDDEILRKWLIKYFDKVNDVVEVDRKKIITWLEKQNEQKTVSKTEPIIEGLTTEFQKQLSHLIASAMDKEYEYTKGYVEWVAQSLLGYAKNEQTSTNKVESKFKVGDWVVSPNGVYWHIDAIRDSRYQVSSDSGNCADWSLNTNICHKFTIRDAKDGDVLSFNDGHGNDSIELIKSITGKKIEFWFCLTNGNRYEVFDGITPYTNFASREDATPATKEQRNFLLKKMHEAGYEWDAEKKELREIEQKSLWSEEDESHIGRILSYLESFKAYNIPHIEPIKKEIDWLKSLKDRMKGE